MILLRGRVGAMTMNTEEFYGIIAIIGIFAAGAIYAEFRYHTPQIVSSTLHGSLHPLAWERVEDWVIMARGGVMPLDIYGGEGTVIVHRKLFNDLGHNVALNCNPLPHILDELPLCVQRVVKRKPYFGPPYFFSMTPSNLSEKEALKFSELQEKFDGVNVQLTHWKQLADGSFELLGKGSDALRRVQRTAQGKGRLDEIWERPKKEAKEE